MTAPDVDLADVGFDAETTSPLSVEQTSLVAATLDHEPPVEAGDPLPLLWHWAHFNPRVATTGLGPDGHPHGTGTLAARFPRRMWASGRVEANAALVVGEPVHRRSRIASTKASEGRSGSLLIVEVEHIYRQGGNDVVEESQTLVYREPGGPISLPEGRDRPEPAEGEWADTVTVDPVTLFRFSAVTFNSHRIHYDQPYATATEGYPALVVHGPLTAMVVAAAAGRHAGQPVTRFRFRANAPLFVDLPFTLVGAPSGADTEVRVVRNDGVDSFVATAGTAHPSPAP